MKIRVKYIKVAEPGGNFRWWTPEMEEFGQFEFANSLEEVVQKAREQIIVQLEKED